MPSAVLSNSQAIRTDGFSANAPSHWASNRLTATFISWTDGNAPFGYMYR